MRAPNITIHLSHRREAVVDSLNHCGQVMVSVRVMEVDCRVARRSQEGVYSSYSRSQALQTRIQKWGNSLGVRIPRSLADEVGVGPGSEVSLSVLEGELIVKPAFPARFKLEDLLAGITPENLHSAVDTGEPVGVEIL
jgi:antitoxin MazE